MKTIQEKSDVLKIVGQNIKQARLLRNTTQEALGEQINKSTNFVSLIERGESGFSLSTLVDICNALRIDTSVIFNGLITSKDTNNIEPIMKSFSMLENRDKAIVTDLIEYIIQSK